MRLKGRTALVTGGNRGIGLEVCRQLGVEGARILLGSRDRTKGEQSQAQLKMDGIDVYVLQMDLSDLESVLAAREQLKESVDVLVNNAAVLDQGNLFALKDHVLEYTIRVNLIAPVILAKHLAKRLEVATTSDEAAPPK